MTNHIEVNQEQSPRHLFAKVMGLSLWALLIVLCFMYRDEITAERISALSSGRQWLAALILLAAFAVKGVEFSIYGGILYAASGLIFPLPVAVFINAIGSAIMVSIPYFIGEKTGSRMLAQLIGKHPKLAVLTSIPSRNELFLSIFVRMIGVLPANIVSMYLGASGVRYSRYLPGSLLGLFPSMVSFSIMGMNVSNPSSPEFLIAAAAEIGLMLLSLLLFFLMKRKQKSTLAE